ncbi:hypothetical protein CHS0354_035866, partial [Potamilus streckersoni]
LFQRLHSICTVHSSKYLSNDGSLFIGWPRSFLSAKDLPHILGSQETLHRRESRKPSIPI